MQVRAIPNINEARSDQFANRTVIVIDVLRATSSILTALEQGSSGVMPVQTVSQAMQLKREGDLLAGERFCKKIKGFDLGNSPTQFLKTPLQGKRIILTSTNGTRVIEKTCKAAHVIAGCFLNATACAKAALRLGRDVMIICAGTQDQFSLEDGLCAGMIAAEIGRLSETDLQHNDFAMAMQWAWLHTASQLETTIHQCENGIRLTRLGYEEDVAYCANVNISQIVPILQNNVMVGLS